MISQKALQLTRTPLEEDRQRHENNNNNKRISLVIKEDSQHDEQVHYISLKQTSAEMNAIGMMMDREIKKALWVDDPLRLNIEEEETEEQIVVMDQEVEFPFADLTELPFTFKLKSREMEANLLNSLYVGILGGHQSTETPLSSQSFQQEYVDLTMELPFATATLFPPTPPPKQINSTPAMPPPIILPLHMYEITEEQPPVSDWLYTRDEDQSTLMTSSPRMSTTTAYFSDEGSSTNDFTEETWDAIFHPLSTFKPKKGELEYYAWNPVNLPVAAARVAQRVLHTRTYYVDDPATIPQLAPTPPLKPSPVLTILEDEEELEREHIAMDHSKDGYYFDMLHKIRGNQRYSNASSLVSSLGSTESHSQEKKEEKKTKEGLFSTLFPKKLQDYYNVQEEQEEVKDPENLCKKETRYWTGNRLFWTGFLCPFIWYYATFCLRGTNDIHWQKRCRLASIYFSLVISVVVLVVGVKSIGAAGARQASSDTIRAVIAN